MELILNPDDNTRQIIKAMPNMNTQRNYMNSIRAIFKFHPDIKVSQAAVNLKWKVDMMPVEKAVRDPYMDNVPSARQTKAYVPWQTLIDKRDKLDHDSTEYLLLSLYSMIPPVRCDFGVVRIHYEEPVEESRNTGNYLVVRPGYIRLVLNEFKSKSKSMPRYDKVLPFDLTAVIRKSITTTPRDYLIVSPLNGLPYVNDHSYSVYLARMLGHVVGEGVTIQIVRRMYANTLEYDKMTYRQIEESANDMLHSVKMHLQYRLMIPKVL